MDGRLVLQYIVILKVGHIGIFILIIFFPLCSSICCLLLILANLNHCHLLLNIVQNLPFLIEDVESILQFLLTNLCLLFGRNNPRDEPVFTVAFVVDMSGAVCPITSRGDGILECRNAGWTGDVAGNQVLKGRNMCMRV